MARTYGRANGISSGNTNNVQPQTPNPYQQPVNQPSMTYQQSNNSAPQNPYAPPNGAIQQPNPQVLSGMPSNQQPVLQYEANPYNQPNAIPNGYMTSNNNNPYNNMQPSQPPKKSKTGIIIAIICIVVAGLAVGGFFVHRALRTKNMKNGVEGEKEEVITAFFSCINVNRPEDLRGYFPDENLLSSDSKASIDKTIKELSDMDTITFYLESVKYIDETRIPAKEFKRDYKISVDEAYDMTVRIDAKQIVSENDFYYSEDFDFTVACINNKWVIFAVTAKQDTVSLYDTPPAEYTDDTEETTEEKTEVTTEATTEAVTEEKTEETSEETTEEKTEATTETGSDENVVDFTGKSWDKSMLKHKAVLIDNEVMTMPFAYSDIKDKMFFDISDYGSNGVAYDENFILNSGQYVTVTLNPVNPLEDYNNTKMMVHLSNITEDSIKIYDSSITSIDITFNEKTANKDISFVAPGGATYGMSQDKIKDIYGEPDDIYDGSDENSVFVIYKYKYEEGSNTYNLNIYFDGKGVHEIEYQYIEY